MNESFSSFILVFLCLDCPMLQVRIGLQVTFSLYALFFY